MVYSVGTGCLSIFNIQYSGMAQGPGNLEKVPEEILVLFPGDSRSFFPEKPLKFQKLHFVF